VALGTTLAPLNSTMIAVALPRILEELHQGPAASAWLVTAYLVAMAALQPFAGALGDRFGRRRLMLLGLGWFGIVSLGATFAAGFTLLAACRIQQGIAAAIALPNGTAVARDVLPPERRARGFSLIGSLTGIAAAGGPPLGGLLVATAGWRAMFLASVPIVLTSMLLAWRFIPAGVSEAHAAARRDAQRRGWLPHLTRPASFAAACATVCLSNLAFYTTLLVVPLLFANAPGWTSARSGGVLAALLGASLLCTPLGGTLADRFGRRWPAVGGQALVTVSLAALALATTAADGAPPPLPLLIAVLVLAGVGLGIAGPGTQTAAVEAAGAADAGAAAGLYSTSRYVGSIVGSAALAALLGSAATAASQVGTVLALIVVAAGLSAATALGLRAKE
jgi:MFS family permease